MIYYHPLNSNSNSNSSLAILCSNSLFSCKSLVKLVLRFNLRCTVRLPAFVHLPNLKALQLLNVEFRSDSSSNLKEQTLSFPILEKFECKYCVWYDVQIVSLQVPLLETVVVKCHSYHSLPFDHPLSYDDRAEPFDHPWPFNHPDCIIKLCASRLIEFTYVGALSQEYILSDPSLAPNISAILVFPDEVDVRTCKLIKQFNHVKYLNLDAFQVSAEAIGSFLNLPPFLMLQHLDLGCVGGDMLMDLLPKTPNLTTLEIEGIYKLDEELLDSAVVPHCLSDSLKEFYLGRVSGEEDQFRLAKYVMENGLALERLSFSPTCPLQESRRELNKVKKKLLSFKKGSNLAIIEFPICRGCD